MYFVFKKMAKNSKSMLDKMVENLETQVLVFADYGKIDAIKASFSIFRIAVSISDSDMKLVVDAFQSLKHQIKLFLESGGGKKMDTLFKPSENMMGHLLVQEFGKRAKYDDILCIIISMYERKYQFF